MNIPDAGEQQQAGLDEGGEVFHLAVAVLVIGVSRLVRNPHRHQSDNRGNQIKHGVQSFRKNSQAARGHAYDNLEGGNGQRRQNGVASHGALFGAHRLRTVNRGRSRHSGIIAVGRAFGLRTSDVRPRAADLRPLGVVRVSPRRICYVLRNRCCKVHGDHQPDPSPISRSFSPRWSIHPHALILMRFKQGRKLCMHRATCSFVIAALTVASATLGAQAQSAPINLVYGRSTASAKSMDRNRRTPVTG